MYKTFSFLLVALSFVVFAEASADTVHVVRRIPGYTCEMLNITESQARDVKFHVPVYQQPSSSSPVVGDAGLMVAVKTPRHSVNDFTEALFWNGAPVWIKNDILTAYHSLSDPTAKCFPALLSSGRVSFDFSR